jgi:hypothetical protein
MRSHVEHRNQAAGLTRTALFLIAAALLIGIGYIAMLPPFEGFDEYAYYSSIRQVADTATIPFYRDSFIDKNVEDYLNIGPMRWGSENPPFTVAGRMTYQSFFANADAVAHYRHYRLSPADWSFAQDTELNWEAQHPPLYYILTAPVMRATEGLSLVTQVLILRVSSYLLAFAGLLVAWLAMRSRQLPGGVLVGFFLFPFIVPMFFGEFARIGNDSLCALLLGVIFALSFDAVYRDEPKLKSALATGICFGLGLLTKALFLPVLTGYALLMVSQAWRARSDPVQLRRRTSALLLVLVPTLLLGGGWYAYQYVAYGSPFSSFEMINLADRGGLIANLLRNFSFYELGRQMVVLLVTWSWGGSWSLVRISPLLHLPLLIATAWIILCYIDEIRRKPVTDFAWLPVWIGLPFFAGLAGHILVAIALGTGGTPGWYLNVLAPFLALAVAYGIERINRSGRGRIVLAATLAYAAVFFIIALWCQMALFAGCAIKSDQKYYQFTGHWFCLDRAASVTNNLSVIAWPSLAFACIGAGFLFFAIGSARLFVGSAQTSRNLYRTVGLTG